MAARHHVLGSLLLLGSLGLASASSAARLVLAFEYPRRLAPSGFVITASATGQGSDATLTVAASAPGACSAVFTDSTADTYCASLGCFPPGRYRFFVQAQVGGQLSPASETLGCLVDAQCGCTPLAPGVGNAPVVSASPVVSTPVPLPPLASSQPDAAPPVFAALPMPPSPPPATGAT